MTTYWENCVNIIFVQTLLQKAILHIMPTYYSEVPNVDSDAPALPAIEGDGEISFIWTLRTADMQLAIVPNEDVFGTK